MIHSPVQEAGLERPHPENRIRTRSFTVARKHLYWAAPLLALLLAALGGLLALPAFVAAPAHRAAMERLASRLTGRDVHISGKLSLSYLPRPTITATGISITSRNHETITARALSFDVARLPLLVGRFDVRTLNLNAPDITIPWPMPGGIHDISPPPWLAALHATLRNGTIHFGAVTLADVNATLYTGARGSANLRGAATLVGHPVTLALTVGETALHGGTSVIAHAALDQIRANFNGTLDAHSLLKGRLTLTLPRKLDGQATLTATANSLSTRDLEITGPQTQLSGTAKLTFTPFGLASTLAGQSVNLTGVSQLSTLWPQAMPMHLALTAKQWVLGRGQFAPLRVALVTGANGVTLQNLMLGLSGDATLTGTAKLARNGALSGHLRLSAPDMSALDKALGLPTEPDWRSAFLQGQLGGTRFSPSLDQLSGTLGNTQLRGHVILGTNHAAFQLAFGQLALMRLARWVHQLPPAGTYTVDGELTAAQATLGPVKLSHLFIDASAGSSLNIRRITANLYDGIAGGGLVLTPDLTLTSAHFFMDLPSASPLATLLPKDWPVPEHLLRPHLHLEAAFAGPPTALSGSAVMKLGDMTLTTASALNLDTLSAAGTLSLRAPDAISLFKTLTLVDGCSYIAPLPGYPFQDVPLPCLARATNPGLAFPGPGSLSLRSYFTAAPGRYQLADFMVNAGALVASGQLTLAHTTLSGHIDAATLVLPALPATMTIPDRLPLSGKITLAASQVVYAGKPVLGAANFSLTFTPEQASLNLTKASLGHGTLSGQIELTLAAKAPPHLHAQLTAQGIDASILDLPQKVPLALSNGWVSASADLTANGPTAQAWGMTLAGHAVLSAENGVLNGISLPALMTALNKHQKWQITRAMTRGTTPFASLSLAGDFAKGTCTLTKAVLSAPTGTISALGTVDLPNTTLALTLKIRPALLPPLTLTTKLSGAWTNPARVTDIKRMTSGPPAAHPAPTKIGPETTH